MTHTDVAKHLFRPDDKTIESLRRLLDERTTYELIFPACIKYLAYVDNKYDLREEKLYKMIATRMNVEPHSSNEFEKLAEDENLILITIKEKLTSESTGFLLELLYIMATYDGKLKKSERHFLDKVAKTHDLTVDEEKLDKKLKRIQKELKNNWWNPFKSDEEEDEDYDPFDDAERPSSKE